MHKDEHHHKKHHNGKHPHNHNPEHDHAAIDDEEIYQRRISPVFKYVTVLVILAFLALLIPNLSSFFPGSYSFLHQDQNLLQDPIVKASFPAIVSIEAIGEDGLLIQDKTGTGFNIRADGLIMTNYHVISDSRTIKTTFLDGQVLYTDRWKQVAGLDIALIDVSGKNLPVLTLDFSAQNQPGEVVTVIGNPFGLERFTQRGSITRRYRDASSDMDVFGINIAARPGISGSPVINSNGQVTGIVFAARSGNFQKTLLKNTALAIPLSSNKTAIQTVLSSF